MWSKNKPKPTLAEHEHIMRIKELPCVVCDEPGPSECHEFEQGLWWASVPLCQACHRGPEGYHGTRLRWTLQRMDMVKAINDTVKKLMTG